MKNIKDLELGNIIYIYKFGMNIQFEGKFFVRKIKCKVDKDLYPSNNKRVNEFDFDGLTLIKKKRFLTTDEGIFKGNLIWLTEDNIYKALELYKNHLLDVKKTYEIKMKNLNYGINCVDSYVKNLKLKEGK